MRRMKRKRQRRLLLLLSLSSFDRYHCCGLTCYRAIFLGFSTGVCLAMGGNSAAMEYGYHVRDGFTAHLSSRETSSEFIVLTAGDWKHRAPYCMAR
jgi:hypothetical protein